MLAPLGFSCPRCLLLRRGAERWASLARLLSGSSSQVTSDSKDATKDTATKSTTTVKETTAKVKSSKGRKRLRDIELPPEPTTCCMSGCANCVWLDYAQTLAKLLGDNDEEAREIVLSKITDPNLKMFLSLELRQMARQREEKAAAEKAKTPPKK
ncbi:oxidoreductase-like domain-containing protein 1 isoform X2 [Drosophila ficusphila]|uniref:oxidoreductase-like domain-containing protein 1 isoform X2 n=1 Tax=Drosophila ficusphila TaxID=30025 RepID=UPI0007E66BDD|nr:oxidoreductase-like domain-containing protein 1 isoform X2 [Drosophila ficusphila]XP_017052794.1 oxidoreductase-like domain-containing protein 1 isoform X2 [Drosophila ficusphila]